MMRTYRCPNGCTVSDEKKRCKKCDAWLKYDGDNTIEEIEKKSGEIQLGNLPSNIETLNSQR